ncbi:MAG: PQQ-like beta-propeller repeat protein [Kiritimatiellaeota bacterium]|nr:PQQ-like beta-propeller repeat protein [Kiritimatiellota bacterium]
MPVWTSSAFHVCGTLTAVQAAVAAGAVVSLGPLGHVMAVDGMTGELLWTRDLVAEYGSVIPQWYAGQCVLADGEDVILAPAGTEALLCRVNARTGEERWRTPNPGLAMSHSSVLKCALDGEETYVYVGIGGVAGIGMDGTLRWLNTEWAPPVAAPSPVALSGNRLFLSAGYGYGGAVLEVRDGEARVIQRWKANKGLSSEQQTAIVRDGIIFGIMPKDAGASRQKMLACDAASDTLCVLAESPPDVRFGLGPYLLIGERFYIVDDDGVLYTMAFEGNAFAVTARHKVLPGHDSWGPMAYADGFLIVRDATRMTCLDLRQRGLTAGGE